MNQLYYLMNLYTSESLYKDDKNEYNYTFKKLERCKK